MNGNFRYELAKAMVADRQRAAGRAATAAQLSAARRDERAGASNAARPSVTVVSRMRTLLRSRTA
jgi:hypothetical protein